MARETWYGCNHNLLRNRTDKWWKRKSHVALQSGHGERSLTTLSIIKQHPLLGGSHGDGLGDVIINLNRIQLYLDHSRGSIIKLVRALVSQNSKGATLTLGSSTSYNRSSHRMFRSGCYRYFSKRGFTNF